MRGTSEETLDVGQCSHEPCSQRSSFSGQTCGVKEDCCCSPRSDRRSEKVVISCFDDAMSEMVFLRVKECGCSSCVKRETVIKGEQLVITVNVTVFDCLNHNSLLA